MLAWQTHSKRALTRQLTGCGWRPPPSGAGAGLRRAGRPRSRSTRMPCGSHSRAPSPWRCRFALQRSRTRCAGSSGPRATWTGPREGKYACRSASSRSWCRTPSRTARPRSTAGAIRSWCSPSPPGRWSSSSVMSRGCSAVVSPRPGQKSCTSSSPMPRPRRRSHAIGVPWRAPDTPRRPYEIPWSGPLLRLHSPARPPSGRGLCFA